MSGYAGWIGAAAGLAGGLYDAYNQNKATDNVAQAYRDSEDMNYQNYVNNYNAYKDWAGQKDAAAGANAAARAAYSAQVAGGKQKEAKKKLKQYKKGTKFYQDQYNQAQGNLQPYIETGHRLLPQQEKTYSNAMNGMNMMQAYLEAPQQMQKMNATQVPTYAQDLGELPDYLKGPQNVKG